MNCSAPLGGGGKWLPLSDVEPAAWEASAVLTDSCGPPAAAEPRTSKTGQSSPLRGGWFVPGSLRESVFELPPARSSSCSSRERPRLLPVWGLRCPVASVTSHRGHGGLRHVTWSPWADIAVSTGLRSFWTFQERMCVLASPGCSRLPAFLGSWPLLHLKGQRSSASDLLSCPPFLLIRSL